MGVLRRGGDMFVASEVPVALSASDLPFVTDGRTVIEADIVNFAGFSGDFGPYHLDHSAGAPGCSVRRCCMAWGCWPSAVA